MAKKKTSKKQKFCFEDMPILGLSKKHKGTRVSTSRTLKNKKEVALALFLCLEKNDPESFVEILDAYLDVNKSELSKKTKLARSTVQGVFSKKGNPTLRTIAYVVHEAVA